MPALASRRIHWQYDGSSLATSERGLPRCWRPVTLKNCRKEKQKETQRTREQERDKERNGEPVDSHGGAAPNPAVEVPWLHNLQRWFRKNSGLATGRPVANEEARPDLSGAPLFMYFFRTCSWPLCQGHAATAFNKALPEAKELSACAETSFLLPGVNMRKTDATTKKSKCLAVPAREAHWKQELAPSSTTIKTYLPGQPGPKHCLNLTCPTPKALHCESNNSRL